MMNFDSLTNKRVLITGGSKGIGKAIALAFADCGANVVITGRNMEPLQQAGAELQRISPLSSFIGADVTDIATIGDVVDEAAKNLGGLDILINNAGLNIPKPAFDVTEQDWDTTLDTNLKSAFFFSQKAARYMIRGNGGKIINIASQMAFVGYRDRAAYCASKGGMVQLTKALAVEWAQYQINVNAVAPTFIKTELTAGMFKEKEFEEDVMRRILLGRLATGHDITGAVLFLASGMADMITGETIKIDGGWTAI